MGRVGLAYLIAGALAATGLSACGGGATTTTVPSTRPGDFAITFHHADGTVAPPYHSEWTVQVRPGGVATVAYARGYSTRARVAAFRPAGPALDRIYASLRQQHVLSGHFAKPAQTPVGGGFDTATIRFSGRTVTVPPYANGDPLASLNAQIIRLVPDRTWRSVGRNT